MPPAPPKKKSTNVETSAASIATNPLPRSALDDLVEARQATLQRAVAAREIVRAHFARCERGVFGRDFARLHAVHQRIELVAGEDLFAHGTHCMTNEVK